MAKTNLTAERLRELLSYDPETGIFTRLTSGSSFSAGDVAGGCRGGYIQIRVDGVKYSAHRLAWLYVFGEHPTNEIDHIDGDGINNKITNLRGATHSENQQNKTAFENSSSGLVGVSWHKRSKKWYASIGYNGSRKFLGSYKERERAYAAYLEAKAIFHTFQPTQRPNF
jgi:hypothetical protein